MSPQYEEPEGAPWPSCGSYMIKVILNFSLKITIPIKMAPPKRFKMPNPLPQRMNRNGTPKPPYSTHTLAIYRSRLNALAQIGWDSVDSLMEHAPLICQHITSQYPGADKKDTFQRRLTLCAIFAVLPQSYIANTNPFHQCFTNARDPEPEDDD